MTDQTIPADQVRDLAKRLRSYVGPTLTAGECQVWERAAEAIEALLPAPPLPTLADMPPDDRAACQWMQCEVHDVPGLREGVLVCTDQDCGYVLDEKGETWFLDHTKVTPRPDLPRMEWPGDQKPAPAPAPALPGDWRLADHREYGRVLVVRVDGEDAIFGGPFKATGIRTHVGRVADLTFVDTDQGADQ